MYKVNNEIHISKKKKKDFDGNVKIKLRGHDGYVLIFKCLSQLLRVKTIVRPILKRREKLDESV